MGFTTSDGVMRGIWLRLEAGHVAAATTNTRVYAYDAILDTQHLHGMATVYFEPEVTRISLDAPLLDGVVENHDGTIQLRRANVHKPGASTPLWHLDKVDPTRTTGPHDVAGHGAQWQRERVLGSHALETLRVVNERLLRFSTTPKIDPFKAAAEHAQAASRCGASNAVPTRPSVTRVEVPDQKCIGELEAVRKRAEALSTDKTELREELDRARARLSVAEEQLKSAAAAAKVRHYAVMATDDLVRSRFVERQRGVFRTTYRLVTLPFDAFLPIAEDQSEVTIPYRVNRLSVLSPHPPESFELVPVSFGQTKLKIRNGALFWTMPYLVIAVN